MKAYRYRLYPTKSQVSQMEQTLEICRWAYNATRDLYRISVVQVLSMIAGKAPTPFRAG
ncbi:MAG: helix-turn-helix domain-containing protein [Candidatus Methanoculleus thermohydrogenotrophicum]